MLTMCEITCYDKFTGIAHHAKLHRRADANDQTLAFLKLDSLFQWRFRKKKGQRTPNILPLHSLPIAIGTLNLLILHLMAN